LEKHYKKYREETGCEPLKPSGLEPTFGFVFWMGKQIDEVAPMRNFGLERLQRSIACRKPKPKNAK